MKRVLVFSSLVSSLAKHASSMSGETNHCGMSPLPNRVGLSTVRNEGARSDYRSWSQKVERCTTCAQRTEYAGNACCQFYGHSVERD
jgi:hypothetical protein